MAKATRSKKGPKSPSGRKSRSAEASGGGKYYFGSVKIVKMTNLSIPVFATSDRRLKRDIRDYRLGLKQLVRVRPVSFRYKDAPDLQLGVIAQEIERVAPTLVQRHQGVRVVNYSAFLYMLINSVKSLSSTVDQLTEEVANLRRACP